MTSPSLPVMISLPLPGVTVTSLTSKSPPYAVTASPYLGAYAASQFAKEGLSDALRRELRPFGVAVSVVAPGAIQTPIWEKVSDVGHETLDAVKAARPTRDYDGRYGDPSRMIEAAYREFTPRPR